MEYLLVLSKSQPFLFLAGEETCESDELGGIAWENTNIGDKVTKPCPWNTEGIDYVTIVY